MVRNEYKPQILYRVFGNQPIQDLLPICTAGNIDRFTILTTTDYPHEDVLEMKRAGFEVIPPTITNNEAGQNSAGFLNQGLEYLREMGHKHTMLMASGYQASLEWVDDFVFHDALRDFPNRDVYFAITPDVHGEMKNITKSGFGLYENRKHFFPSESLAVVKIDSVYPLNESMSTKMALGTSKDGYDLGGIELMLTIMEKYKSTFNDEILKMCAISCPTLHREGIMVAHGSESRGFRLKEHGGSVEFTPNEVKWQRREETVDRAMEKLGMNRGDYERMFSKTKFVKWGF